MKRNSWRSWVITLGLIAIVVLVAACAPGSTPGASGAPGATPTPAGATPVHPANPGADPLSLIAWAFTPVFQGFFIALVLIDLAVHNIAIAIIIVTILLRILLIPPFRRQTVSTRRMQMLAPEVKEIQRRLKGNRAAVQTATQELYRERGVNPLSGCLPLILTFVLLIPMYQVFSQGLQSYNVQPMLDVAGVRIVDLHCPGSPEIKTVNGQARVVNPCLDPVAFGVNWGVPEILFGSPGGFLTGFSLLALISALLQFVQSRMALPATGGPGSDDPNSRIQRQMTYVFPFISLAYGALLPAGLFLYWIVSTLFTIVQQYLIIGWGGMFPIFGWTPGFAKNHQPRFPVTMPPPPDPSKKPASQSNQLARGANRGPSAGPTSRASSADKTIRPRERGRQGRRGRRR